MLKIYNKENRVVETDSDGLFKLGFPEPTVVGQKQVINYVIRNDSKMDRYEITDVTSHDEDVDVGITTENRYLYPKDEIEIEVTFHPPQERRLPLQDAQIKVDAFRVILPEQK